MPAKKLPAKKPTAVNTKAQVGHVPSGTSERVRGESGGRIWGPKSSPQIQKPPKKGEVRFYKKVRSGGGRDTLVQLLKSCGHRSWQGAYKAVQAEKGLEHLEGRKDWKTFQHCGKCTGGGVWRVAW